LNKENVQKEEGVVDENSIISDRRNKLDDLRKNGIAFPNQFKPQHFSSELHKNYDGDDKETLEGKGIQVSVSGRMMLKRVMGKASFASIVLLPYKIMMDEYNFTSQEILLILIQIRSSILNLKNGI